MPALAPVDRLLPPVEPSADDVASAPAEPVEVSRSTVVEAEVPVMTEVIVVKLWAPPEPGLTGATSVDKKVLVDRIVDELEVVARSDVKLDTALAIDEVATERLEGKIGATSEEDATLNDEVLVDTLVEVVVKTDVVELVDAIVIVEDEESDVIVEVVDVVNDETLELVMVSVADDKDVERFDGTDWLYAKVAAQSSSTITLERAIALAQKHRSIR